ncbi:MAG: RnfABCDGE type electron transport complex subunit B [Planctomycetota bacterium]|nr:RnfABCDGE type electron transport complex subunit B [Planctomycetota bacterium]
MDWNAVVTAVSTLGGVAFVFGVLIALAQRHFYVQEDPRLEAVTELLPGSNCGACGFPGCRTFAEGLVSGDTQPAGCTQLSADAIAEVADYLGVEAGEANKRVARLLCAGGHHTALQRAEYRGLQTCAAAATIAAGGKACTWGCLGLADCEVSCDYDAITMNAFGLPVVDTVRCTACNDCVEACPKDLFVLMPVTQHLIVQCRSLIEGDTAEELCKVACTACGKCALDAAPGVIAMQDGLAVIDYEQNERAGPEATARCPTGAIVWVDDMQFAGEGKQ